MEKLIREAVKTIQIQIFKGVIDRFLRVLVGQDFGAKRTPLNAVFRQSKSKVLQPSPTTLNFLASSGS